MRILAMALRVLAACLRLLPLKQRVAFLSRQSSRISLDYRLLSERLRAELPDGAVVLCLTDPETNNVARFASATLKQLYYACTSKVVIVDGYVPAVSIPPKDDRISVIQLWHALGAVKKFGYQCLDTPAGRTSEDAAVARMHRNYDYVIAGGQGAVRPFAQAFDIDEDRVLPLGLPRIDYLLDDDPQGPRRRAMRAIAQRCPYLEGDKRIVLYAPTLRRGNDYRPDWLSAYLRDVAPTIDPETELLVVAPHPLNSQFDRSVLKEFPWVRVVENTPTIDLLGFAHTVVTDYSAVAFEAAYLGKHLRFYTPDLVLYRVSPGLNIPVDTVEEEYFSRYFAGLQTPVTPRLTALIRGLLER